MSFHNARLVVLGQEALKVLEEKGKEGMPEEVHDPLFKMALKAAGIDDMKDKEVKVSKRCKRWNRGFCRERDRCSYSHHSGDCEEHLKGGCTQRGCTTLRHRKQCKYFDTSVGCHRGETCEYLHKLEKDTMENVKDTQEIYVEKVTKTVEKEFQTEAANKCTSCKVDGEQSDVLIKEDKLICIMKRAKCSES